MSKSITLPWCDQPVYSTGNISERVGLSCPSGLCLYLPENITILYDREVEPDKISDFILQLANCLVTEFGHRSRRRDSFSKHGLMDDEEYEQLVAPVKRLQPWILYYSNNGGLGEHDESSNTVHKGMIPCASMRNHGVAWSQQAGEFRMWLVTSRRKGEDWDVDSDLGHESAHACFAPIPLFVQSMHLDQIAKPRLAGVRSVDELEPGHIALICYMITEIAVVAVRGERRETDSGLPVADDPTELQAFLRITEDLMPGLGFGLALETHKNLGIQRVNVNEGELIFQLGASCLRALKYIKESYRWLKIPAIDLFFTTTTIQ